MSSFNDEDFDASKNQNKRGLRVNNQKSTVPVPPKPVNTQDRSAQATRSDIEYKEIAMKLSSEFYQKLKDKTLNINKSPAEKEDDLGLISELVQLAEQMNLDEFQNESAGSLGIITLLLRCTLWQRDQINELNYKLELLSKLK